MEILRQVFRNGPTPLCCFDMDNLYVIKTGDPKVKKTGCRQCGRVHRRLHITPINITTFGVSRQSEMLVGGKSKPPGGVIMPRL